MAYPALAIGVTGPTLLQDINSTVRPLIPIECVLVVIQAVCRLLVPVAPPDRVRGTDANLQKQPVMSMHAWRTPMTMHVEWMLERKLAQELNRGGITC